MSIKNDCILYLRTFRCTQLYIFPAPPRNIKMCWDKETVFIRRYQVVWCGRGAVAASSGPAAGWALYWATGNEIPYLSSSEQQQAAVMVTAVCCRFVTDHFYLIKPVHKREKWLRSGGHLTVLQCRIKIIVAQNFKMIEMALNVISVGSSWRDASAVHDNISARRFSHVCFGIWFSHPNTNHSVYQAFKALPWSRLENRNH